MQNMQMQSVLTLFRQVRKSVKTFEFKSSGAEAEALIQGFIEKVVIVSLVFFWGGASCFFDFLGFAGVLSVQISNERRR